MSVDPSEAAGMIEEYRAFYSFLKRLYGLEQADLCLGVLGGDAVEKLEAALSDRSNFGMAKAMFMAGREAGFDMSTREGIEARKQSTLGTLLTLQSSARASAGGAPSHAARKAAPARKNKNKRKARKRNR